MKPIHELNEKEWNKLSWGEKSMSCAGIPYLAHNFNSPDYYFYALKHRICNGSKIPRKVWESLSQEKRDWLEKQTGSFERFFVEHTPIYEMTEAEWDALRWHEQQKYETNELKCVHGYDFYIDSLLHHVINGGKISKRIWDHLAPHQQRKLIMAFADTNEEFFKSLDN